MQNFVAYGPKEGDEDDFFYCVFISVQTEISSGRTTLSYVNSGFRFSWLSVASVFLGLTG